MRKGPAYDPRKHGAECDQCPLNGHKAVGPRAAESGHPRLVVVTESPSETDVIHGEPLVGRAGDLFDKALDLENIPRHQLHVTHAVACRPPAKISPTEWKQALKCCRPRLFGEVASSNAPILALGAKAQQTLTNKANIFDWMGAPEDGVAWKRDGKVWRPLKRQPDPPADALRFDTRRILSTLHPAYCLMSPAYTPVFRKHLRRAWWLANDKLPEWKWPEEYVDDNKATQDALSAILIGSSEVSVDIETNKNAKNRYILNVGIADKTRAVSITWQTASREIKALAKFILAKESIAKVFWNIAFDKPILERLVGPVNGHCDDWMLAKMIIAPGISSKLTHASCFELHSPRWKTNFKASKKTGLDEFESADPRERALYNGRDAWITLLLGDPYRKYLSETHNGWQLYNNAMENTAIGIEMSRDGVCINRENLKARRIECEAKLKDATERLVKMCTLLGVEDFNPKSHPQRQKLFRTTLGVTLFKDRDGKYKLDKKVLEDLCSHQDPRVRTISRAELDRRSAARKLDYIDALDVDIAHPWWKPGKAITGRWASSEPNLMNIPKPVKDPQTKEIIDSGLRVLFDARPGMFLVEMDYSALEARTLALLCGDECLLEWLAPGNDVHVKTAATALRKKEEEVTSDERERFKGTRYAFHYGSTPETAFKALVVKMPKLTLPMVEKLFEQMTALHPRIIQRNIECVETARKLDYVECPISGRRHHFHGKVDANQAKNLPNQMGGSALIDDVMRRLRKRLGPGERILMQVHDSLVCEGPDPIALGKKMREEMERPVMFLGRSVSFPVDAKYGTNWGALKKLAA